MGIKALACLSAVLASRQAWSVVLLIVSILAWGRLLVVSHCELIRRCSEDGSQELEVTEPGRSAWTVDALLTADGFIGAWSLLGRGQLFFFLISLTIYYCWEVLMML